MATRPPAIELTGEERRTLAGWAGGGAAAALALRAKAILMAAGGAAALETARRTGVSRQTVNSWRRLFLAHRTGAGFIRSPAGPDAAQRSVLEGWAGGGDAALAARAKLILLAAEGLTLVEASRRLGCGVKAASRWRRLFLEGGPQALAGRPPSARRPLAGRLEADGERRLELERLSAGGGGARPAARAKALLSIADGASVTEAARLAGIGLAAACRLLRRFVKDGPRALLDARGPVDGRRSGQILPLAVDSAQRAVLEGWARGHGGGPGLDLKAKVVLLGAEGVGPTETARRTGVGPGAVYNWRKRFLAGGIGALLGPKRVAIGLDDARRAALERLARGEGGWPGLDVQAKAILLLADGLSPSETARRTGETNRAVVYWRGLFLAGGIESLTPTCQHLHRPGAGWPPPEPQRGGFVLTGGERFELERWVREGSASAMAERARIILLGAGDLDLEETARRVGVEPGVALYWWRRFLGLGLEGLLGAPPGGPQPDGAAAAAPPGELPPGRTGPWTAPALARSLGLERSGARPVMVELVAPPAGPPDAAGADPGPLARRAAALAASPPPAPLGRWTVEAVARALGVSRREARRGLVEAGRWPLPGGRPPDGGGGG
jgi:transposase-like protein